MYLESCHLIHIMKSDFILFSYLEMFSLFKNEPTNLVADKSRNSQLIH